LNIVADESVDGHIVTRLRADGHTVEFIAELDPGIPDEAVLGRSRELGAILLTADKDFGELVFRQGLLHSGIVLLRLAGMASQKKAELASGVFFAVC
jgi:predicted nuclease of predicted toxin-antitoxin system